MIVRLQSSRRFVSSSNELQSVVSRAHKEVCLGELAALEAHITTREEEKHGLEAELARLRGAGQRAGGVTQPGLHGDGDTPPTPHVGQQGAGHTQPLQQELLRQQQRQEEQRRQQEEKQKQEDQRRQQEEQQKLEEQRRQQEEQQRQEEQRRQQEEQQNQEEQRRQQEEQQRQQDQGVQS